MKKENLQVFKFLILLSIFLIFLFAAKQKKQEKKAEQFLSLPKTKENIEQKYHLSCPYSGAAYLSSRFKVKEKVKAKALIVPHELTAKDLINEAMENTSQDYQIIILAAPNLLETGEGKVQTSNLAWKTKFGNLKTASDLILSLKQNNLAKIEEKSFEAQESICRLVSFVKKQFPQAQLLPLVLKNGLSQNQTQSLGRFLAQNCQNCLLLVSVNFSPGFKPKNIKNLDKLNKEAINKLNCDFPQGLQLLGSFLKEKGSIQGQLINRSAEYITMLF